MADSLASEQLVIQSHVGPYTVDFDDDALARLAAGVDETQHFVVDERVADLYADELRPVLDGPSVLLVEATEAHKSLDRFPAYVEHLAAHGVRRGHALVAVGGGIMQDIVCFLAATMLRGLEWRFLPTTLLAQADSCIGSKSSINVGAIKNVLGTFTPPSQVWIATRMLDTLDPRDVRSGVGEMLKVHAIAGPDDFNQIAGDYDDLFADAATMRRYIRRSLEIKKAIIEEDEFDKGVRNVMNYGHSFGHAIESATQFGIPHGIAVTIGMDMANYTAARLGHSRDEHYARMHPTMRANYTGYEEYPIDLEPLLAAIGKDKKNVGARLKLVLPDHEGRIGLVVRDLDDDFRAACADFLAHERTR
jgi:3-dehydroquinate synthase